MRCPKHEDGHPEVYAVHEVTTLGALRFEYFCGWCDYRFEGDYVSQRAKRLAERAEAERLKGKG